jgi:hypothetical protein
MKKEKSFRARWGAMVAEKGITPISTLFLRVYPYLEITNSEAMFIVHCFSYKWTVDSPFPALGTIAREMGVDRNTVQRHARSLQRKGFLVRNLRTGNTSLIDFSPLLGLLEYIAPYPNLDKESIQNCKKVYLKTNTKEEALIKSL